MLKDTCGRTIDTLRISVTDRCNYRCTYCTSADGCESVPHTSVLTNDQIAAIVQEAAELGIRRIRFTGGEPLLRDGLEALVHAVVLIPGIDEVTMTTNGALLTDERASALKIAGLDRVTISLDTLDPYVFRRITRGGNIDDVLRGIRAVENAGFTGTKINMVVFEDTDAAEIAVMKAFCMEHHARLQTIARFELAGRKDHAPVPADRPHRCVDCRRLRLTADGNLLPCLFSDRTVPVDHTGISKSILAAVAQKPESGSTCRSRTMVQIGG